MTKLTINGTDYIIKFGYNAFCDTDLMERVQDLAKLFKSAEIETDGDVSGIGRIKDLFCVVRELLFVGFKNTIRQNHCKRLEIYWMTTKMKKPMNQEDSCSCSVFLPMSL